MSVIFWICCFHILDSLTHAIHVFLFCFTEIDTKEEQHRHYTGNYTAPRSGKYFILGEIHKKGEKVPNVTNSIRLLGKPSDEVIWKVNNQNETQFVTIVELVENTTLLIQTNDASIKIDEIKSSLKVYKVIFDSCMN